MTSSELKAIMARRRWANASASAARLGSAALCDCKRESVASFVAARLLMFSITAAFGSVVSTSVVPVSTARPFSIRRGDPNAQDGIRRAAAPATWPSISSLQWDVLPEDLPERRSQRWER
jgi:hypothetical protein